MCCLCSFFISFTPFFILLFGQNIRTSEHQNFSPFLMNQTFEPQLYVHGNNLYLLLLLSICFSLIKYCVFMFDLEQSILCPVNSVSVCPFCPLSVVTGATDGIGKAYAEEVRFPSSDCSPKQQREVDGRNIKSFIKVCLNIVLCL